jgi:starch synthase (maltosyl-transferring)
MAKRPASSKPTSASPRRKQTADERPFTERTTALEPTLQRRVVVEAVRPQVDGGRFPIKRVPGERVTVTADIFADGHDELGAVVLYRKVGDAEWREAPMAPVTNDRWQGAFTIESIGGYEYTVEGWVDRFATWRRDLIKKVDAGQDVASELLEGSALIRETAARAQAHATELSRTATQLAETATPSAGRVALAGSEELRQWMAATADRQAATRLDRVLGVLVERERARFGSWYEMFPRSAGRDPHRSATFDDAAVRLPYIAGMGFDVLYLPPVHPIGRSFRKGPNNTLTPGPGDPGSPWAIGSEEGGHMAIEPGLGTLDDFDRFVEAAGRHGLEIALDIAFQASPDHPYVGEHPEWFRQRPDGTIKYAENPPKKYQDIYPINFESSDWPALWQELKRVFEFWIAHGVRIFRVDNPHTKPFRFWHWVLGELHRDHPDTIFLSEAFTRPKVMRYLAKCGFSQSYSYFTWRNTAAELQEYFTELTQTDVREYMRPNLFANTPDILHEYLQRGGRPAFAVRLVLAATLGASYGIYSGFELFENVPVKEGSEEYLDSEKYQIRPRDFDRPDSLAGIIRTINTLRRDHPALQHDHGLHFHPTDNPELLCYSKRSVDGSDLILCVVNVDPFNMQHGYVRLPIGEWSFTPNDTIEVEDLLSSERYYWRGASNYVRLEPGSRVAHVLHVRLPRPLPPAPSLPDPS